MLFEDLIKPSRRVREFHKFGLVAFKGEKPQAQQANFSPSKTVQYGQTVSRSYQDPKTKEIVNEMIETPEQKQQRLANEQRLNTINTRIGSVYDETSPIYQGFKDESTHEINKIKDSFYDSYNPLYKNTRNDIYGRLGTLDSTQTGDILAPVEKQRIEAEQNFAKDLQFMPRQLADQEVNRLMTVGGYYQGLNDNTFNDALKNYGLASNGSQMGTSLSQTNAQAINQMRQTQMQADAAKYAANMKLLGDVAGAAGTAYASDKKIKKNINKIGTVKDINFYNFEYKTDEYPELPEGKHIGVIAQEIENIIPDAVIETDKYKIVDYKKVFDYLNK